MWQLTLVVSLLSMIGPFTIDAYLPAFESMEQDLNVSRSSMTQTLGIYLIAFASSTLIWGAISDWLGRKPVILLSLTCYFLASVACATATNYEQLLLFRILQGLGVGGSLISGRAMVRDLLPTKEAQKVMAKAMMLFAMAPAIAPLIGGWLHDAFGWRSIFWFLSFYAISVILFVLITTKESLEKDNRNSIHILEVSKAYLKTLSNPHYLRLVFILAFGFSSFFIYVAGAPTLLFNILHLEASQFYLLFIPVVSGILIGAFISNHLISIITNRQIINIFLSMMLLISIVNVILSKVFEPSLLLILIPLTFYSISLASIMPVLSIMILDCFPRNRGVASAMQSFIQMGFNGIAVSVIVSKLEPNLSNFGYAQVTLASLAFILWITDKVLNKK